MASQISSHIQSRAPPAPPPSHRPTPRPEPARLERPVAVRTEPPRPLMAKPQPVRRAVPAETLCDKIRVLMHEFNQGLWSGKLVAEYEGFFKEKAEPNLLELVLQMENHVVKIERPYGHNTNKLILYSIESDEESSEGPENGTSVAPMGVPVARTNGGASGSKETFKYPYTFRYVHAPLPWLGVRTGCYVTLAHSPSYFWVQIKSPQLEDLTKISELIQTSCHKAAPEPNGRFYVNELVCGLFDVDGMWYRAIVLDVGTPKQGMLQGQSCLNSLDPALFLPDKPTPQFTWKSDWKVKLFFIDYGNIEWLELSKVRRKKFPYPAGQAFRCSLGDISPKEEWDAGICQTFKQITEERDAEQLKLTVLAVKSEKAHYGFKSRLNEYCQKRKLDMAIFERPLNSQCGWRTSCEIKHPTKGMKTYQGYYQIKKNDAEASAAQRVIRDWDIPLLLSEEIPAYWIEVLLENAEECYNKSLVDMGAAVPKTSVFEMDIAKQPDPSDVPILKSELITTYTIDSTDSSEEEEDIDAAPTELREPPLLELPVIGDLLNMNVTHVESARNICVRNLEAEEDTRDLLLELEDRLTDYLIGGKRLLTNPQPNDLCAVYSNDIAYRGRVLRRSKKETQLHVLMVDYGDSQVFSATELYEIEPQFLTLPYQAISCTLYGFEDIINPDGLTDFIKNSIEEKPVLVRVKDIVNGRTLLVELYDENNEKLNDLFKKQDIRNLKPSLPSDGERAVVKITNVSDEGVLSLQISGPGLQSLGELMKELREHYEQHAPRASDYIVEPRQGQLVCSSCVLDDQRSWYRACIDRKVNDTTSEVLCVDYGSTQIIPNSKLREPTRAIPNINRLPFQALSVRLADLPVAASRWTSKEVDTLKGYITNHEMVEAQVVEISDNNPVVKIYLNSDDSSQELNKLLSTDRNLFVSQNNDVASLTNNFNNSLSLSLANPVYIDLSDVVLDQNLLPKLNLQRQSEALISHVQNPYLWYFQSQDYKGPFDEMTKQINLFYSQPLDSKEIVYRVNDMCVAYCDVYQGWYRAMVIKTPPNTRVLTCSMVDYGDTQDIPITSIRPLVKQFANLPKQACRAALAGVVPADGTFNWGEEAKSYFSAATTERFLWVRYVGRDADSHTLWMNLIDTTSTEDLSISAVMISKGLAVAPASS